MGTVSDLEPMVDRIDRILDGLEDIGDPVLRERIETELRLLGQQVIALDTHVSDQVYATLAIAASTWAGPGATGEDLLDKFNTIIAVWEGRR